MITMSPMEVLIVFLAAGFIAMQLAFKKKK